MKKLQISRVRRGIAVGLTAMAVVGFASAPVATAKPVPRPGESQVVTHPPVHYPAYVSPFSPDYKPSDTGSWRGRAHS